MGAKISKEKIENMSTIKLLKLKTSIVRNLKPDVLDVYEQRMTMQLVSIEEIISYTDE